MAVSGTSGNDAGLLQVIGGIRSGCDRIVEWFSDHHGRHPDHSVTECPGLTLGMGHLLAEMGGSLTITAANLINAHLEMVYGNDDDPDGPIDYYPQD